MVRKIQYERRIRGIFAYLDTLCCCILHLNKGKYFYFYFIFNLASLMSHFLVHTY